MSFPSCWTVSSSFETDTESDLESDVESEDESDEESDPVAEADARAISGRALVKPKLARAKMKSAREESCGEGMFVGDNDCFKAGAGSIS